MSTSSLPETIAQTPTPRPKETGPLMDWYESHIHAFALTGSEDAYREATWASRVLAERHQERRESAQQAEKGEANP